MMARVSSYTRMGKNGAIRVREHNRMSTRGQSTRALGKKFRLKAARRARADYWTNSMPPIWQKSPGKFRSTRG